MRRMIYMCEQVTDAEWVHAAQNRQIRHLCRWRGDFL